ncbi:MAG: asparagine synthase (glutamine-hydrolyzing), partial [Pseudomonadales bacterium]|nr:asparagine synthase (glutamine-hydrolyzing) [Pseudomonadales bacterium]
MCGITGFWDVRRGLRAEERRIALKAMCDTIAHRGPDDSGYFIDSQDEVALGHRRLSIIDVSPLGHQPMQSISGRYQLVYNGEIFNFKEMREELVRRFYEFRGGSDTEVILAMIEEHGLDNAVKRFNGQFAIALWDEKERVLHLVRDRIGIKPLYYGWSGGVFLFGSELKAMRAFPLWQSEISRDNLTAFMRHACYPAPLTAYSGIYKLMPGSILSVDADLVRRPAGFSPFPGEGLAPRRFWSFRQVAESGQAEILRDPLAGLDQLTRLLRESVARRMIADVPLGAFLSGGIDSSLVVALMQEQASKPVQTFTIGFNEDGFNEAEHAAAVAQHLGTKHTELYVTPDQAREIIPALPYMFDEPFADSSQLPTRLVAKLARTEVTVALSGDGG